VRDGDDDVLFDFGLPVADFMIEDVESLFELLGSMKAVDRSTVEDAKFNSYIQIRIRSYNRERELVQSSLASKMGSTSAELA